MPRQASPAPSQASARRLISICRISRTESAPRSLTESQTNTSGVLSVTDGTHTAQIRLLGQYAASQFAMASDGHSGTMISDMPTGGAAPAMIAATHYT
jgi:hypothetical protein